MTQHADWDSAYAGVCMKSQLHYFPSSLLLLQVGGWSNCGIRRPQLDYIYIWSVFRKQNSQLRSLSGQTRLASKAPTKAEVVCIICCEGHFCYAEQLHLLLATERTWRCHERTMFPLIYCLQYPNIINNFLSQRCWDRKLFIIFRIKFRLEVKVSSCWIT